MHILRKHDASKFWCGEPFDITAMAAEEMARWATCRGCIEAFETEPQPVTTRDLAAVAELLLLAVTTKGDGLARVAARIQALEAQLRRPRTTR